MTDWVSDSECSILMGPLYHISFLDPPNIWRSHPKTLGNCLKSQSLSNIYWADPPSNAYFRYLCDSPLQVIWTPAHITASSGRHWGSHYCTSFNFLHLSHWLESTEFTWLLASLGDLSHRHSNTPGGIGGDPFLYWNVSFMQTQCRVASST